MKRRKKKRSWTQKRRGNLIDGQKKRRTISKKLFVLAQREKPRLAAEEEARLKKIQRHPCKRGEGKKNERSHEKVKRKCVHGRQGNTRAIQVSGDNKFKEA